MLTAIVCSTAFISPAGPQSVVHALSAYSTCSTCGTARCCPPLQVVDNKQDMAIEMETAMPANGKTGTELPYLQLLTPRAAGDAAMLLLFAAIGRGNHNTDGGSVFTTAAPFLLSWSLVAPLVGAYRSPTTRTAALLDPLPAIAVSVPLGCALRGVLQGYQPPLPFWIVALIATTVRVEGWRLAFFALDEAFDQFADAIVGAYA